MTVLDRPQPATLEELEARIERALSRRRMHRSSRPAKVATDVYRFYDAHGHLLYVGLSCAIAQRIGAHRNGQGWWAFVVRIEVEHLPTRDDASARERELIALLRPRYNRNGGGA